MSAIFGYFAPLQPLGEFYSDWSIRHGNQSCSATKLRSILLHLEPLHQLHCQHVQLQFGKSLPNAGPRDIYFTIKHFVNNPNKLTWHHGPREGQQRSGKCAVDHCLSATSQAGTCQAQQSSRRCWTCCAPHAPQLSPSEFHILQSRYQPKGSLSFISNVKCHSNLETSAGSKECRTHSLTFSLTSLQILHLAQSLLVHLSCWTNHSADLLIELLLFVCIGGKVMDKKGSSGCS